MEKDLIEIKQKLFDFCDKYNIKDIKIDTTEVIFNVDGKPITNDISIKIEV